MKNLRNPGEAQSGTRPRSMFMKMIMRKLVFYCLPTSTYTLEYVYNHICFDADEIFGVIPKLCVHTVGSNFSEWRNVMMASLRITYWRGIIHSNEIEIWWNSSSVLLEYNVSEGGGITLLDILLLQGSNNHLRMTLWWNYSDDAKNRRLIMMI